MKQPLSEYPRPQFQRESYLNLNGYWDYAIIKDGEKLDKYQGKILAQYLIENNFVHNINISRMSIDEDINKSIFWELRCFIYADERYDKRNFGCW